MVNRVSFTAKNNKEGDFNVIPEDGDFKVVKIITWHNFAGYNGNILSNVWTINLMFPPHEKWHISPPWSSQEKLRSDFVSMDAVFRLNGEIISKGSQSEIFPHKIDGKTYYVKRYFRTEGVASWLGFSRLRVEARNQRWFNKMKIAAARVVVYGEESVMTKTCRGVLITEGIEAVMDLAEIARNTPDKFKNTQWCKSVILDLASIVRTLHQNRFCHNDLHWRNILIQQYQESDYPKVFLIDCPSGKHFIWPLLQYRKLKDLASMDKLAPKYLSKTQRLRFFLAYRQSTTLSAQDKSMINDVFRHKENRLKRKKRVRTQSKNN